MRVTQFFAAAALALASTFAVAAATDSNAVAEQAIRKSLQNLELEVPVESVASSPLNGLYEVKLQGGRVLYASADGQFVMQGYLFQIQDGKPVNLTEKTERMASPSSSTAFQRPRWWFILPRARPSRTSPCSPIPPAVLPQAARRSARAEPSRYRSALCRLPAPGAGLAG